MCCNFSKINETENGMLVFLNKCNSYQLTYKNIYFSLSEAELLNFKEYLKNIDVMYWEKEYENSIYSKRIPIPTQQNNLVIILNSFEIQELIFLLSFENKVADLKCKDILLPIFWN